MPELKPTLATAMIGGKGEFLYAFDDVKYKPGKEAEGYATCLILPAPRPIADCPEEWKDGRIVWLLVENPNNRNEEYSGWGRGRWVNVKDGGCWLLLDMPHGTPTHVMLPPPSPKEVKHA